MEDASKEFQIFLSPKRDYQQPYREVSTTKHRVVPVINKIISSSSSSSSSSFTLNQRKCSVYKAVSGVSFQDTDVSEKKQVSKRERKDKKRERRQSYATPIYDSEKKHYMPPPAPGTRRSKSLTSMESAIAMSNDSNKNLPEITHPFTPVIIYNQSSGSRKSRYSRVKERKRSSSQVRNSVETKKHDSSHKIDELPIRPRRSRSASRSRQALPITVISDDSSCSSSLVKDSIRIYNEKLPYRKVNSSERMPNISKQCQEITSNLDAQKSFKSEEIDFSVNDSDWRKYDKIVTEKLDSLLKKKEEPEGGYFSLEREEADELENLTDNGDHFERENSSESIYIAQAVSKEGKLDDIPTKYVDDIPSKYDQYTIEEIYSEVPFSNHGQEVGFVDDEGLYEEIFFDKSNETNPTVFSNASYGETKPISIKVTPEVDTQNNTQSMPKLYKDITSPKIEKSSSSTIVYIGGEDKTSNKISFESSSVPLKHSSSCNNLIPKSCDDILNNDKRLSFIDVNDKTRFEDNRESQSGWCGCQTRPDSQFSHSASCIKSRSGILSGKCSFIDAQKIEDIRHPDALSKLKKLPFSLSKDSLNQETDYELSDIDLDMFAPKTVSEERLYKKNRENMLRSSSEAHLNHQPLNPISFSTFSKSMNENLPKSKDIVSPKTFRGFLEDSIFNPPDSDLHSDENEDLVIKEDQIVTCISDSDSSSSSSSDEEENEDCEAVSPWLEAQNEFEFVTFQKEDSKAPARPNKKKKNKKLISIPKLFANSFLHENISSHSRFKSYLEETSQTPERPNRRRKKISESKLGEVN